jgi:hypothetical protein
LPQLTAKQKQRSLPPKKQKKIKKILKEAEARAQGEILGQYKARAQKPWDTSLKEHLGHWIDHIQPLELGAILAGTYMLHGIMPSMVAQVLGLQKDEIKNEGAAWCTSYFISYILVHHFGSIAVAMGELGKGLLSLVEAMVIGSAVGGVATKAAAAAVWTIPASFIGFVTPMPFGKDVQRWYEDWVRTGVMPKWTISG